MTATVTPQDTEHLRLFLGDHLAGATWVDAHRGPLGEPEECLACHRPRGGTCRCRWNTDTRLRLRFIVAGIVADEVWLDTADPDAQRLADLAALVHTEGVDLARANDVAWLIEVYQPSAPPEAGYLRAGSDPARMAAPVALILAGAESEAN